MAPFHAKQPLPLSTIPFSTTKHALAIKSGKGNTSPSGTSKGSTKFPAKPSVADAMAGLHDAIFQPIHKSLPIYVRSTALWILWNCRGCNSVIVLLVRLWLNQRTFLITVNSSKPCGKAARQQLRVCGNGYKSIVLVVSRLFFLTVLASG